MFERFKDLSKTLIALQISKKTSTSCSYCKDSYMYKFTGTYSSEFKATDALLAKN